MAGNKEAEKLIEEGRSSGVVLDGGTFEEENKLVNYVLIRLDNDNGIITQFDYGSDLKLDQLMEIGDRVNLEKLDEYNYIWNRENDDITVESDDLFKEYQYTIKSTINEKYFELYTDEKNICQKILEVTDN